MKQRWFYIPVNPPGFVVTILAIVFMEPIIMAVVRSGHAVSDDLY